MYRNVCFVVLVDERLRGLAIEERHVLRDRIARFLVVVHRHQLVGVLHAEHLNHLTVQMWEVINLRCALGQLDDRLVLHDPLSHGRTVGVRHGDNFYEVVVRLLRFTIATLGCVVVIFRGVVTDDFFEELELLLHRVVDPRLYGRHGF